MQRMRGLPLLQRLALCAMYRVGMNDREVAAAEVLAAYQAAGRDTLADQAFKAGTDLFTLLDALQCGGFLEVVYKKKGEKLDGKVSRGCFLKMELC